MKTHSLVWMMGLPLLAAEPFCTREDIFPLDVKHNHASSIVRLPDGDLMVTWYRGSGERTADDVQVMGSRWRAKTKAWSKPFVLGDVPDFPDTNPMLFVDSERRLWLFWQTIVANRWETSITNVRMATDLSSDQPTWSRAEILLVKPVNFVERVRAWKPDAPAIVDDKYAQRMGWMTRAHATQVPGGRILVPLYSDGYNISLVAYTDDGGQTWKGSEPLLGAGNVQPSIVRKNDGTLVAYMRDNGPPPKRVLMSTSKDNGQTWTIATDTGILNSGTGLEAILLKDGRWLMINNDTERGRQSLALTISEDEGATWRWKRHIELDPRPEKPGSFHYPSIVQAPDGTIHASYSVFENHVPEGQPRKTIRHAHFNLEWVMQGGSEQ